MFAVLCMAFGGAVGDTEKELANLLHVDNNVHNTMKEFVKDLKINPDLAIAFSMFTQYNFLPSYIKFARDFYLAEAVTTKFENPGKKIINNWVKKETNNLIKKLIPDRVLSKATHSVLINAIYFKSDWMYKFDKKQTEKRYKFLGFSDTFLCDMMMKYNSKQLY
jgi:serpin B